VRFLGADGSLCGGRGLRRFLGIGRGFGLGVRGGGKQRKGCLLSFQVGRMRWRSFAAVVWVSWIFSVRQGDDVAYFTVEVVDFPVVEIEVASVLVRILVMAT
jgi:hypothetical protein